MIFQDSLAYHLEKNEWFETDKGYVGSAPKFVKCPTVVEQSQDPDVQQMQARVRNPQETINVLEIAADMSVRSWWLTCSFDQLS